jgi:dipeptidyl aminopeptidase/acylaminoacyl peptidase
VAPDGKSVAIVVSSPDYETNQFESRLVLVDIASGEARDLTFERPEVSRPRWSPSGERLAFLAQNDTAEDPQQQVFLLPISGGEARVITAAPRGVSSFEWSADGEEIFYVAADAAEETPEGPERHNQSFVVTHHDYLADQRPPDSHIWRLAIDGGDASRINGDDVVAVGGQFSWLSAAPDGSALVFYGFRSERPGDFMQAGLSVIDLETGIRRDFSDELRTVMWGALSPDGSKLAYSRGDKGTQIFRSHHIAVGDSRGGTAERVTPEIDRSLWGATWMPDNQGLLVGARDAARNSIWHQPLSGKPTKLDLGDLEARTGFGPADLDIGRDGGVAFIATTSQRPAELYWLDSIESKPRRLTDYNSEIAALDLATSEEIQWEGPDGFQANGILTYPPGFDGSKRYPLVLKIHGGPMSASTLRFDALSQLLAARGFVVFAPNYRGSDNLGARYQEAVIHDAGEGPGRDVMAGLEAVRALGFVDESRIGVSGWSYGGYMTSWLIGNFPDVWRAAMAGAPVTDYVDSYALSDINTFFGFGFDRHPWSPEGQAEWREQSPIAYAFRATTPTLILCNTGDLRVPITQSYKLYHALDEHGVPVQFVAYPIPGHFPRDPVHQRDVYRRWVDWMEHRFELPREAPVD